MTDALAAGGTVGGRYELEALIGKGGFAEVWRARHVALNSRVAIKFLLGTSAQSESMRRRFTTEAQITAQLKSQNAVQVFDFGFTDGDRPFLVMELLEGETLGRRLERVGRLDVYETARILGQSSRALHRAHQLGIVHRDFKPENVVIAFDDEGRDSAKVLDFGIAKLVGDLDLASATDDEAGANGPSSARFTKAGAVLGTPYYMAPEQVRNAAEVDLRADVWAFGVVAYECLTGRPPFTGKTLFELFDRIRMRSHPKATEIAPDLPAGFDEWFDKACGADPDARFPGAQAAYKALLGALDVGRIDLDPSVARKRSAPEPRLVLHGTHEGADAPTVDIDGKRGVDARHRSEAEQGSFRRLTIANPLPWQPPAPSDVAVSHTLQDEGPTASPTASKGQDAIVEEERRNVSPPRPRRVPWVAVVGVLVPLAAVAVWRARATARTPEETASSSAPPIAAPQRAPETPPLPSSTIPSPPLASASALATTIRADIDAGSAPASKRRVDAVAPSPPPRAVPALSSAPPPPAPSPAPSSTASAPLDPGSYR